MNILATQTARNPLSLRKLTSKAGGLIWRFLELQLAMGLGALVCYLIGRLIPASSSFALAYQPGTYLYAIGDVLFLTVPVVAWMIFRGHGWQYSAGMVGAMVVPVAAIVLLGQLAAYSYLSWLVTAGYPAMSLGMLAYILSRGDHFTRVARIQGIQLDPSRSSAAENTTAMC